MTTSIVIDVRNIAERYSTRDRAEEAYKNLLPVLQTNQQVVLELDSVSSISPSFLDGLLLRLVEHDQSIWFKTDNPHTRNRLQRLVLLRNVDINVCDEYGNTERLGAGPFKTKLGYPRDCHSVCEIPFCAPGQQDDITRLDCRARQTIEQ